MVPETVARTRGVFFAVKISLEFGTKCMLVLHVFWDIFFGLVKQRRLAAIKFVQGVKPRIGENKVTQTISNVAAGSLG